MTCLERIKTDAKYCKIVCCAYGECRGSVYCGLTLTIGQDARCTMQRHIDKVKSLGAKEYKAWLKAFFSEKRKW